MRRPFVYEWYTNNYDQLLYLGEAHTMKTNLQSSFKFSLVQSPRGHDVVDLDGSLPSPSQVVSKVLYQYEQSKSPSKRLTFPTEIPNCRKHRAMAAPTARLSALNLHGINLLKPEQNEISTKQSKQNDGIAELIWEDADCQNTNFTTPYQSRLNTSQRDTSSLIDSIKVTRFKSNESEYPFYQTTYLKMARLDDWSTSYQKQLLSDYPQHNHQIKQLFKCELAENELFKVLPKLFRIDSGLYNMTVSEECHQQNIANYSKSHHRKKHLLHTIDAKEINNEPANVENDDLQFFNLQALFNENLQQYLCSDEAHLQNKRSMHLDDTSVPYTPRALSMRRNCLRFRKKWS